MLEINQTSPSHVGALCSLNSDLYIRFSMHVSFFSFFLLYFWIQRFVMEMVFLIVYSVVDKSHNIL